MVTSPPPSAGSDPKPPTDRRQGPRTPSDPVSPEFLAVLVMCGGEVRGGGDGGRRERRAVARDGGETSPR